MGRGLQMKTSCVHQIVQVKEEKKVWDVFGNHFLMLDLFFWFENVKRFKLSLNILE